MLKDVPGWGERRTVSVSWGAGLFFFKLFTTCPGKAVSCVPRVGLLLSLRGLQSGWPWAACQLSRSSYISSSMSEKGRHWRYWGEFLSMVGLWMIFIVYIFFYIFFRKSLLLKKFTQSLSLSKRTKQLSCSSFSEKFQSHILEEQKFFLRLMTKQCPHYPGNINDGKWQEHGVHNGGV